MSKKVSISIIAALCVCIVNLQADDNEDFSANIGKLSQKELSSTDVVEIYSKQEIEESKAESIYEFLGTRTSVIATPSYGNKFSQSLDIRGFGGQNGYQNIVVVVDGKRLNNIDGVSQLLSAVPIESVKKIEILKGGGGVEYGDGANSVISITTMDYNGLTFGGSYGSFDSKRSWANYGYKGEKFNISASGELLGDGGDRTFNAQGDKSDSFAKNGSISLKYFPIDPLLITLSKSFSHIDTRYSGALTQSQFDADPTRVGAYPTRQIYNVNSTNTGVLYDFGDGLKAEVNGFFDKKSSMYVPSAPYQYQYNSFNSSISKTTPNFEASMGIDGFDGTRESPASLYGIANNTSKNNLAIFAKSIIKLNEHSIELGARDEKVSYSYSANAAPKLTSDDFLQAYSIGYNYKISNEKSLFANYSRSFTSPDIDSFFTPVYNAFFTVVGASFNGFIKPQKADNYNIGYSFINKNDKLKLSAFYTKLQDEIFFNPISFVNTNLDSTHKTGLEISERHVFNDIYSAFINYSFIEAKIDNYAGNTAYNGKYLPGASRHNAVLGLEITPIKAIKLSVSEKLRSSTYNYDDFANIGNNKQPAYRSTDLSASYGFKNYEIFAKATNIFGAKNAIVTSSNGYYPIDFESIYAVGFSAKF